MTSTVRRALIATGAAGAMVAGLGVTALIGGSAAGAATVRATVNYRVNSTGSIVGPSHLHAGTVAIKLNGYASQQFQLVKPFHAGYSKKLLADNANLALQKGNPRPLESNFALVGGGSPHNVVYLTLEAGKYYAVDPNRGTVQAKNIATITVTGKKTGTAPRAHRVVALGMHSWGHAPGTIPQSGVLRFSNKSSDWHFIEIDQLQKGKTFADVQKALKGQQAYEKVFVTSGKHHSFSMAVVSPGRGEAGSYYLNKGNYAILCFFPDHRTGTPHAFEGMARSIKVG